MSGGRETKAPHGLAVGRGGGLARGRVNRSGKRCYFNMIFVFIGSGNKPRVAITVVKCGNPKEFHSLLNVMVGGDYSLTVGVV